MRCTPLQRSLTITQFILRIFSLLLCAICLGITIYLSLRFSITYLIVYVVLVPSIIVSEASLAQPTWTPSSTGLRTHFNCLAILETLCLGLWVATYIVLALGKGDLVDWNRSDYMGPEDKKWAEEEGKWKRVHKGLIIGIIVLHLIVISIWHFGGWMEYHHSKKHESQRMSSVRGDATSVVLPWTHVSPTSVLPTTSVLRTTPLPPSPKKTMYSRPALVRA